MFQIWKKAAFVVGTSAAVLATAAAPASAHSYKPASVSVVHGIPNLPVDVFVNGEKTLSDFQPKTVAGPLKLKPGSYDIDICAVSDSTEVCDSPAISVDDADVPSRANISLVAHLNEEAKPVLTPFVNDVSRADRGEGRLIVRHTAAAPAVDILAGGDKVGGPISNSEEFVADLKAGTVNASVVAAGTTSPAVFNGDVEVERRTATFVYAVGNLSADPSTFDVVTQTIDLKRGYGHGHKHWENVSYNNDNNHNDNKNDDNCK